ncbi:MAG: hypothetical protein EAZ85_08835 [Bacteroidetes bacterium]|nr:MAG: hypothetical protein EAZ85_08835 [Bacteroidota bacterium]
MILTHDIYAQIPDLFPEKNKSKEDSSVKQITINQNIKKRKERKIMVGVNLSKMLLRPIFAGGFTIDTEIHRIFAKSWAVGAEIGYTDYYWKATNFNIRNKGFYFKPMISYLTNQSIFNVMGSIAFPMGIFDEKLYLDIPNSYYTFNPNETIFNRNNQLFHGVELIISNQIEVGDDIYLSFGVRYAPILYTNIQNDSVPMNVRYFPGSGYNLDYSDRITPINNLNRSYALFCKFFVRF